MSKNDDKKGCFLCLSIRYFIFSVLLIIIVALTASDQLHLLKFVTPLNFAIFVLISGLFVFVIKLLQYFQSKKD